MSRQEKHLNSHIVYKSFKAALKDVVDYYEMVAAQHYPVSMKERGEAAEYQSDLAVDIAMELRSSLERIMVKVHDEL